MVLLKGLGYRARLNVSWNTTSLELGHSARNKASQEHTKRVSQFDNPSEQELSRKAEGSWTRLNSALLCLPAKREALRR